MSTFNSKDYDRLFELGRSLYNNHTQKSFVREIAVELMAMCESVRGQQAPWPKIDKRYRRLTTYPPEVKNVIVVPFKHTIVK